MFDSVNVDFGSRILAEEDFIVNLDLHGNYFTVLIKFSFPHPNDPTFLRLFFGGVRDNNTPLALFFFLNSLDDDAVLKRPDLHAFPPFPESVVRYRFINNKQSEEFHWAKKYRICVRLEFSSVKPPAP